MVTDVVAMDINTKKKLKQIWLPNRENVSKSVWDIDAWYEAIVMNGVLRSRECTKQQKMTTMMTANSSYDDDGRRTIN